MARSARITVKKKRKVKGRFFVILFLTVAIIVGACFLIFGRVKTAIADNGKVVMSMPASAVVIRDESCYSTDKYDRAIYDVHEGDAIQTGDTVATIYKWGYKDDILQSLLNTQAEILDEQMNVLGDAKIAELDVIDGRIKTATDGLMKAMNGETGFDALKLEDELKAAMAERETLLEGRIQATESLMALYSTRDSKQKILDEWTQEIISARDGRVSLYFDGYEQALNPQKLELINVDLVNTVLAKSNYSTAIVSKGDQHLLYRVAATDKWYIAFVSDAFDAKRVVKGESYFVEFDGYKRRSFSAEVEEVRVMGESVLTVLRFDQDVGADFMAIRKLDATIKKEAEGVRVPLDAIFHTKKGNAYVVSMDGHGESSIGVTVLAADDSYAIVRAKNETTPVFSGQKLKLEG